MGKIMDLNEYKEKRMQKKYLKTAKELEGSLNLFHTAWGCINSMPKKLAIQLIQKAHREGIFELSDLKRKYE